MSTVITQDDDQSRITVPIGSVVELHLVENPSTGFLWSFDEFGPGLELVADDFHQAGSPLVPGAAGVHEWRLRVIAGGSHEVRMRRGQP